MLDRLLDDIAGLALLALPIAAVYVVVHVILYGVM